MGLDEWRKFVHDLRLADHVLTPRYATLGLGLGLGYATLGVEPRTDKQAGSQVHLVLLFTRLSLALETASYYVLTV